MQQHNPTVGTVEPAHGDIQRPIPFVDAAHDHSSGAAWMPEAAWSLFLFFRRRKSNNSFIVMSTRPHIAVKSDVWCQTARDCTFFSGDVTSNVMKSRDFSTYVTHSLAHLSAVHFWLFWHCILARLKHHTDSYFSKQPSLHSILKRTLCWRLYITQVLYRRSQVRVRTTQAPTQQPATEGTAIVPSFISLTASHVHLWAGELPTGDCVFMCKGHVEYIPSPPAHTLNLTPHGRIIPVPPHLHPPIKCTDRDCVMAALELAVIAGHRVLCVCVCVCGTLSSVMQCCGINICCNNTNDNWWS